jgi:hypothetical protein
MKIATARYTSNVPEGAEIYGVFTQPFGAGVDYETAWERLAVIIENNGPDSCWGDVAEDLADELLEGLDFPNEGCEVTFVLYSMED